MTSFFRLSSPMWKSLNGCRNTVPVLSKLLFSLRQRQKTLSSFYCKRFGLYDNEEDTFGEYNRRGAYQEHRKSELDLSQYKKHRGLADEDDYFEDSQPRHRSSWSNKRNFSDSDRDFPKSSYDRGFSDSNRGFQNRSFRFDRSSNIRGYGGPNRFNNRNCFQDSFRDSNLAVEKFDLSKLPTIAKNLYAEHPDAAARSSEEVEEFYDTHNVTMKGNNIPKPILKFSELNIPASLLQLVNDQNFENLTPIQSQGWPVAMSGRDMIGISQTGSGKTLVFMLPAMIHIMNQPQPEYSPRYSCLPQALVLAPTRELAQQIHSVASKFQYSCGIRSSCVYGGAPKGIQLSKMRESQLCIATPGRLIDFLMEGSVSLKHCTYLVLDEADRMLDMGFEPQIRQIVGQVRPDRQTLMWSATWPQEVRRMAEDFLINYVHVTVGSDELSANPNIEQNIYVVSEHEKYERLLSLLKGQNNSKTLIFAQTKRTVDILANRLDRQGVFAMAIHGDVSQARRDRVLSTFRNDSKAVLIATDVAARGLDVNDVQQVINFDFPPNVEDYIHRIGRTARGLKNGIAHSFFTPENAGQARDLIEVLKKANQPVDPELMEFCSRGVRGNKRNYSYGRTNRY